MDIINAAIDLLSTKVSGRTCRLEETHPWRAQGTFIVHHSLRVEAYARKIANLELNVADQDMLLLRLAAILHDIGSLEDRKNHAERGAAIAKVWLQTQNLPQKDRERIVRLIADHSNKGISNGDPLGDILKDADTLDEIGAISIFMAGNWIERTEPEYFLRLSEKLNGCELPFCEKKMKLLTTQTAKNILSRKKAFIQHFIEELDFELEGTEKLHTGSRIKT